MCIRDRLSQIQHGLVEDTRHYVYVVTEICQDLPRILQSVLKGYQLKDVYKRQVMNSA